MGALATALLGRSEARQQRREVRDDRLARELADLRERVARIEGHEDQRETK